MSNDHELLKFLLPEYPVSYFEIIKFEKIKCLAFTLMRSKQI